MPTTSVWLAETSRATITGTGTDQDTTSDAPIDPFSDVEIGDLNGGATEPLTITLAGGGGTLAGAGLSGSGATYTLTGSAAALSNELDALVFTPTGTPGETSVTTFTLSDASRAYVVTSYAASPTVLASTSPTAAIT